MLKTQIKATMTNLDASVIKTNYATWGFSLSSLAASIAQIDWAAMIMGVLGFVSLVANIAFMAAKHKKESAEHKARMILLNRQIAETEIAATKISGHE